MFDNTPAPTSAEKAFEMMLPQNRMAFRMVNSRRVYHLLWMSRAPGNYDTSRVSRCRSSSLPGFSRYPKSRSSEGMRNTLVRT